MEIIDAAYRDTIHIYLDGATGTIRNMTGNIFKQPNSDPFEGNINSSNWISNFTAFIFEARIKELSHYAVNVEGDSPARQEEWPGIISLINEILDNLYLSLEVNAKQYFRLIPAKMFCDPIQITRAAELCQNQAWSIAPYPTQYLVDLASPQNQKYGSGGLNLDVPIEIERGDTTDIFWRFGTIDANTAPILAQFQAGTYSFLWQDGDDAYQDYFHMALEIVAKGSEERGVQ